MSKRSNTSPQAVSIQAGAIQLQGLLRVPPNAKSIVIFAHGSGSGRMSPRNNYVAEILERAGLATILFDLLTEDEEQIDEVTAQLRFDIPLLTDRLAAVTEWTFGQPRFKNLPVACFGASTGAAAALAAAARIRTIAAVVSRGGRPDLAGPSLSHVRAATLLIVGAEDEEVLALNRMALERLTCEAQLTVVAGATHLFAETGALEQVASLAAEWFTRHTKVCA